jgi:putative heme-binding domain-containing protein
MSSDKLVELLSDTDEHIRGWAIQLLCEDHNPPAAALQRMNSMAQSDSSAVVRLYLAAAAQRLPEGAGDEVRWSVLEALSRHGEDTDDHNLPQMIWFALEPLVVSNPARALALAEQSAIPMLTRYVARRLADEQSFTTLVQVVGAANPAATEQLLLGIRDSLEGRYDMKSPEGWAELYPRLRAAGGETSRIALQLSQQFGDSVAAEAMLVTLLDKNAALEDRRNALQGLAGRQRAELREALVSLLEDPTLRRDAIRAVASFDDEELGEELLKRYSSLTEQERQEIVQTMASRSVYGSQLTEAIEKGDVPRRDVPAYVARLLRRVVGNRFVDVWGPIDLLAADKEAVFNKYRNLLTQNALSDGDASHGRSIFQRSCAACHKMYGLGGNIGPDITGANRSNLEYLLGNILAPSDVIQDDYKMHIVLMDDGRIYSGIPAEENEQQLKLRIADQEVPVTIAKSQIESREIAAVSMMPEGTIQNLSDGEVIDLIAYLQSQKQVPERSETRP